MCCDSTEEKLPPSKWRARWQFADGIAEMFSLYLTARVRQKVSQTTWTRFPYTILPHYKVHSLWLFKGRWDFADVCEQSALPVGLSLNENKKRSSKFFCECVLNVFWGKKPDNSYDAVSKNTMWARQECYRCVHFSETQLKKRVFSRAESTNKDNKTFTFSWVWM